MTVTSYFIFWIRKHALRLQLWTAAFLLRRDDEEKIESQGLDGEEFLDYYFPQDTRSLFTYSR